MTDSGPTKSHRPDTANETADFTVDGKPPAALPERIGRYRVERVLGAGGFGAVYLAHDDLLQRPVAVKVPHARLVPGQTDVAAYLAEAQSAASLDHPNIVPVHDVGTAPDVSFFVVSKYIDGTDLAARIREARPSVHAAVEIVAAVADGLDHAHRRGLVHRDVKPGNILLDHDGKPFVADFGVALRERDAGRGPRYAGTPAYMSPEQARGEGHRVDGRSDVFSLGVVLYELLTGRRPFGGATQSEVMEQVAAREVWPPRRLNDAIPPELERVCLKALAKRLADRYASARAFADDLRRAFDPDPGLVSTLAQSHAGDGPAAVVPKGLRSFGTSDADFFLDLIPGPRDRHGLPESIRFWKERIDQPDPDQTFPVGLLYGPSGCGKSSLVKAGLLPRLGAHVTVVYLEATADLEARLLHRLARACPEAAGAADLSAAAAAVRRGGAPGQKVLIVLDQFEQWLHARRDAADGPLVRALRQCDGGRLQCLVTVRDDFWMMASRFMHELEVPVAEGQNAAAVDLFDPAHARKVLEAFGRAYGALPPAGTELSADQAAFLDRAVAELAEDGWVIPVRLALFADLVKRRPWAGRLLGDLGGAVGVGVTFLEESFAAPTAPPEHRLRREAVRGVLAALLPPVGTDIKGHARSRDELTAAAGYENRGDDFDALMRILIGETRLLTPVATDPAASDTATPAGDRGYQLTHDYLVPSVRDWLTRKRMETRRGRAELRLAERAALWHARPEVRQLPSPGEWLTIRLLTRPRTWSKPERDMMRAATRRNAGVAARWAAAAVAVAVGAVVLSGWVAEERAAARGRGLADSLLSADAAEVPRLVAELDGHRRWADPPLAAVVADPNADRGRRVRALLGLLPANPALAADLDDRLLDADPAEFPVVRDALAPHRAGAAERYWAVALSGAEPPDRRLRAAAALAAYDADSGRWADLAPAGAGLLTAQPSLVRPRWVDALAPVRDRLLPALDAQVGDAGRPAVAAAAAEIVAAYAADRPDLLAAALGRVGPDGFALLFPRLRARPDAAVPALAAVLDRPAGPGEDANAAAARRANAGVALVRLGAGDRVWPLLKMSPDPRVRSELVERLAWPGTDPDPLAARLAAEPEPTARAALWLALGSFDLPPPRRAALAAAAGVAFWDDDSAAVHAAARWVLGRWDRVPPEVPVERKGWVVTRSGVTLIRVPAPGTFVMGSPPDEVGFRDGVERAHPERIDYPFEIGMTEVTVGLYRRFLDARGHAPPDALKRSPPPADDAPATTVTWYRAADFCNWLSEEEGIPRDQRCYEPNANNEYAEGMRVVPGFRTKRGYRLPTEAEWEYACRGGAATRRCYGDTDGLLGRYAWYAGNAGEAPSPVARLLPNALGLFDTHGNAIEWCQDVFRNRYEEGARYDGGTVRTEDYRAQRGAHIFSSERAIRAGRRFADRPELDNAGGFRLARGCR